LQYFVPHEKSATRYYVLSGAVQNTGPAGVAEARAAAAAAAAAGRVRDRAS